MTDKREPKFGATDSYLNVMTLARLYATVLGVDPQTGGEGDWVPFNRSIWSRLKDACVFEVPYSMAVEIEDHAKADWSFLTGDDVMDKDSYDWEEHLKKGTEAAEKIPLPEKLPFPAVFVGFSKPLDVSEYDEFGKLVRQRFKVGFYVDDTGAVGYFELWPDDDPNNPIGLTLESQPLRNTPDFHAHGVPSSMFHRWENGCEWLPIELVSLIKLINSFQKLSATGMSLEQKMLLKDVNKNCPTAFRMVPKPYYRIPLRHGLIEPFVQGRKSRVTWQLDHRHRVRGHWVTKFERGPKPIDPRREKDLLERRYKIYSGPMSPEMEHQLRLRNQPLKRSDEWMAILRFWRKDFVRGPADKPLIPGVRVVPSP